MSVKIQWLGHSCFRVESGGYAVILDPFAPGSVPGFRDIQETADRVLCSHEHHDHNYREGVTLRDGVACPFTVTELPSYHDGARGSQRGPNTITILEIDGKKIVHFGDQGCLPEPEQLDRLRGADVILLPVGGHYTVGPQEAKELADAVAARTIVPMHYRTAGAGLGNIRPVEDFLALYSHWERLDSDTLILDGATPAGVVVLTYR